MAYFSTSTPSTTSTSTGTNSSAFSGHYLDDGGFNCPKWCPIIAVGAVVLIAGCCTAALYFRKHQRSNAVTMSGGAARFDSDPHKLEEGVVGVVKPNRHAWADGGNVDDRLFNPYYGETSFHEAAASVAGRPTGVVVPGAASAARLLPGAVIAGRGAGGSSGTSQA